VIGDAKAYIPSKVNRLIWQQAVDF